MHDHKLAVHSVDRFDLGVPDLDQAAHFYRAFGLDVRRDGLQLHIGASGGARPVLHVRQADRKQLLLLRLGVHPVDMPRFVAHLVQCGVAFDTAPDGTLRLRDADGRAIELNAAPKTSPDGPLPPPSRRQAPKRSEVVPVRPRGLSHLLLFTPDVPRAVDFYTRVFGLRLSDRAGDDIAFLHTPHGSDHHLIAFVRSEGRGLHHSSWRVASLDDVGLGAMQMAAAGYTQGWGLGRHVLGSNYFYYVRDPWGGYAEFSYDMDYIPEGADWPAANHDGEDAFFVWGPPPPDGFAVNTELMPQPLNTHTTETL